GWRTDGAVLPVYSSPADIPGAEDPATELLADVEHDIDYLPGTRRAGHARIALVHADGRREDIDLEPLICFRMKGIGYMHPEWGHGMWKGELGYGGAGGKGGGGGGGGEGARRGADGVREPAPPAGGACHQRRPGRHRRPRA